jgi:uncharacterized protein (TIGR00730 family)
MNLKNEHKMHKAQKAYDNEDFLHSRDGRILRIIAEYLQPFHHFKRHNIRKAIIFFGSARCIAREDFNILYNNLSEEFHQNESNPDPRLHKEFEWLFSIKESMEYYEDARRLAKMVAEWSATLPPKHRFHICTGGGPGIMEAANRGSAEGGMPSIGLNISLPFEQFPNDYITPNLNFEFHYFFMRKFWFVYLSSALIAFPGGFGTMDELSETLTLIQTHKLRSERPILLYSEKFWSRIIDFDYLVRLGMISQKDMDLFKFVNTPEEAFEVLKAELIRIYGIKG